MDRRVNSAPRAGIRRVAEKGNAYPLNAAQTAIMNTLADEEIQTLVAGNGYTAEKMNKGKALYDKAQNAVNAQIAASGAQYQSTAQLKIAEANAQDAYQALAKVARAVFVRDSAHFAIHSDNYYHRDNAVQQTKTK